MTKKLWIRRLFVAALATGALSISSQGARATDEPPTQTAAAAPTPAEQEPVLVPEEKQTPEVSPIKPPPPPPDYLFPDLGRTALVHNGKYFWMKPILAAVVDYTWFDQDDASLAQVGKQPDAGELRAGRLGGTMRWQGDYKWDFYLTVDYQERKTRENAVFQLYDLKVGLPLGGTVKLDIGKMKEPIAYELTGLSVLLPQQERILLPFYPSRSIGLKLSGRLAGDRMTWAAGAFNDYLDTSTGQGKNGNDYVARVSALAWESTDKHDFLHLAVGYRWAGSDDGVMRFAGRPESNVADKFTDTGEFPADHADEVSLELLAQHEQFSILAERFDAKVDSPETGNPRFSGWYGLGSWVLTGEGRRYVRQGGFASGIVPKSRYGALELVVKYSRVDLTDGTLDGGQLDKWHFGLDWWASTQWKVGLSWGDADLDKSGLIGNTKMLLVRMQWLWG